MRLVSFVAYSLSILFIYLSVFIAEGHLNLLMFWDLSSAIVILAGICATFINFKASEIFNAFFEALKSKANETFNKKYELNIIVIKTMSNYVFTLSIISFLLSLIISLGNAATTQKLGSSIAVSFIVMMYGLFFKFIIFHPLIISLNKKYLLSLTKELN